MRRAGAALNGRPRKAAGNPWGKPQALPFRDYHPHSRGGAEAAGTLDRRRGSGHGGPGQG